MISYMAHVLSKLEPDHVHKIALVFVSLSSLITAFAGIFAKLSVSEFDDSNIEESHDGE